MVFETQGTTDAAKREEVKTALIKGIENNQKYSVMSNSDLMQVIKQQGFQTGDAFSDSQAIEVGRLTQARYICVSSLNTSNEYEYRLVYKLIDLETGETMEGTNVREKFRDIDFYTFVDKIAESKLFAENNSKSDDNSTTVFVCGCEIQKQDLPKDARIPFGWRLPTLKELKCMCENKGSIGGFNFGKYLSSTKKDGDSKGINFQFCDEVFVMGGASVRVVRSQK